MAYGDDDLLGTGGSYNARYMRDPASAIQQRKYALAQALQKQGMDTSAVVGTGNNTMQALARVLQGGLGTILASRVEGEAKDESEKMREAEAYRQKLILGLTQDAPAAAPAAAPMPDRLGGAPPATDADRAGLAAPPAAPVVPVQREALPPVASRGAPDVPPDLMPHFQAASEQSGIPVAVLAAQAQQESQMGRDPRATANGGGPMQIIGSTARDPGYGMPPISDADRLDPSKAIPWAARYMAARAPGTDWNNPQARDAALTRYNGGGDPNYAANVTRNLPAGAPAPEPTPPGGVAQRTGGTDLAGPGVPQGAAPAPEQPAGPTPADLRRRAAQAMALGGTGAQQAAQVLNQRADALERQQFQTQNLTEQRRLAAEAAEERRRDREIARGQSAEAGRRADASLELQRKADERAANEAARRAEREGVPTNFERDPTRPGEVRPIKGGPADPEVIDAAAKARGGTRPIPGNERDKLLKEGGTRDSILGLRDTFKNDFGGYRMGALGDAANTLQRNTGGGERSDWWQQYDRQKNMVRNELFGASLTSNEQAAFEKTDIHPGMSPETIRANLAKQSQIIDTALRRRAGSMRVDGYSPEAIEEAAGFRFGETPPASPAAGGRPPPPEVGAIQQGHRFKGGDPADPKSWEKVGS
jgi:soluble lytic murein transglycosylase-like protein